MVKTNHFDITDECVEYGEYVFNQFGELLENDTKFNICRFSLT